MKETELGSPDPTEQPRVTRRWFLTRLGLGVAEMGSGLAIGGTTRFRDLYSALFVAGFNTSVFTCLYHKLKSEPLIMGFGSGVGAYFARKFLNIENIREKDGSKN